MRIIVTGGGTGGHIFPALEIAKEIKKQNNQAQVIYVGNKNSLEEKMATSAQIPFFGLATQKIVGQSLLKKLLALAYLAVAVAKSFMFLLTNRPKAVVGVGGYISAPVLIASFFLGIRRYICEQNVVPGLANENLSLIAKRVFISFDKSKEYFPKGKSLLSGNPVRAEFFSLPEKDGHGLNILVTGGSLGASFLNREVPKALAQVLASCPGLKVTHQIGNKPDNEIALVYKKAGINAQVVNFIENMPKAFAEHDLLISRAGATVCAEIMASGMPAILVPYPFANAHQQHNAQALADNKAAIMVLENEHFGDNLVKELTSLYQSKRLKELADNAKSMGTPNAAFMIVSHILND